ncbi:MAG: hypothetical protein A2218_09930 [Elusimicrobia bacterium RIFOXYA2_FULL_53_38]|nr:MAG: hypothetical protein A2218_09930 [Elusimicrobia bacterium RIFOXYA2_FULL_53_38]
MPGLFPVLRLFLFGLIFSGISVFCADVSADRSTDGAGIASAAALPLPQQPSTGVSISANERPPSYGNPDYRIFKDNINSYPDISAQALIRMLNRIPPDRREEFISRHYVRIAEMLTRLENAAASGSINTESYTDITSGLAPFQINTVKGRPGRHGDNDQKSALKKNPLDEVVDARRTLDSEDRQRTETVLKKLKENYPNHSGVQSAVAQYYNDIRNYDMAADAATDAISLDPGNSDAYKARALAKVSLQDRKGAIEDINKALEIDPQDESAKILSALVDSKKDMTGLKSLSSLQEMRKALSGAEVPGAAKPAAGDSVDGMPDEEGFLETGPQAPDYAKSNSYLKTASSKNQLGDYESALKYAALSIEKNPANLEAYLERANACNFLGRYDEAIKDATYVIGRDPANAQALNMRAWALNRKGMSKDAETDANKAIDINPDFADAWFNRALAYEKQGNYKQMLEDFRQAAALNSAYGARFQDAVAQYSSRVPGFANKQRPDSGGPSGEKSGSGMTRFIILLGFTLTGGLLVALGLLHIVTSPKEKVLVTGKQTHPDTLSPSIFYEGVASGKYRIERKIGEGGMGIVYEAVDQSLERTVAIKKMNDDIKVNEREKQRFLEEARTVAVLHHPNIVEIHTIFEEEDNIYLVFEYVNGVTLDKMLDKEVRVPFDKARTIFDEAAKALSYAHSKNVVHRDMKLSNIMISVDNEVKVMDFGLARHAKESLARATSSREVVGSPAYMAPEQDLGFSSKESDIYALGVCLYEALTGELPFKGPDFHYQKEHRLYQPAGAAVPGLPPAVDELIAKTLSPDPENRFKTAEEFRDALVRIA